MPQQINLIDAALLPAQQRLTPIALLATLGTAAALLVAHFGWEQMALARALAVATANAPVAVEATPGAEPDSAPADRQARREALRDLLRRQVAVPEGSALLLGEIIRALPDALWLTELEIGTQRSLRISGGAADTAGFGQFTARLTLIPALQGLPITTLRLEPRPLEGGAADAAPLPPAQLFVLASGPAGPAAATTAAAGVAP
jgi:hypothetical protein